MHRPIVFCSLETTHWALLLVISLERQISPELDCFDFHRLHRLLSHSISATRFYAAFLLSSVVAQISRHCKYTRSVADILRRTLPYCTSFVCEIWLRDTLHVSRECNWKSPRAFPKRYHLLYFNSKVYGKNKYINDSSKKKIEYEICLIITVNRRHFRLWFLFINGWYLAWYALEREDRQFHCTLYGAVIAFLSNECSWANCQ